MWIVCKTPMFYALETGADYCIFDNVSGEIHSFYTSKEQADDALESRKQRIRNPLNRPPPKWIAIKTPSRYMPGGGKQYCILNELDQDLHSLYATQEEADEYLRLLLLGVIK